jgi:hypothetical protein
MQAVTTIGLNIAKSENFQLVGGGWQGPVPPFLA